MHCLLVESDRSRPPWLGTVRMFGNSLILGVLECHASMVSVCPDSIVPEFHDSMVLEFHADSTVFGIP